MRSKKCTLEARKNMTLNKLLKTVFYKNTSSQSANIIRTQDRILYNKNIGLLFLATLFSCSTIFARLIKPIFFNANVVFFSTKEDREGSSSQHE